MHETPRWHTATEHLFAYSQENGPVLNCNASFWHRPLHIFCTSRRTEAE